MAELGYTEENIVELHAAGAHFLRLRDDGRRPLSQRARIPGGPWRNAGLSVEISLAIASHGYYLGLVPGSIGLAAIDVDEGDGWALARKYGLPFVHASATQGRSHIWCRHPGGMLANRKWRYDGCSGDLRCDNGYVVAYDLDVVVNALRAGVSNPVLPEWIYRKEQQSLI